MICLVVRGPWREGVGGGEGGREAPADIRVCIERGLHVLLEPRDMDSLYIQIYICTCMTCHNHSFSLKYYYTIGRSIKQFVVCNIHKMY